MATFARVAGSLGRVLSQKTPISKPFVRTAAYWNKDWKPGPFPKTPAEREAAAKKYGLRPEDYEPYPDDGTGYGDYPKLERMSAESRSHYEDYDLPELKKNFGEPLHVDYDAMTEDKWDASAKMNVPFSEMLMWLGTVLLVTMGGYVLLQPYPHHHPVKPKQFPGNDASHYTFEAAD